MSENNVTGSPNRKLQVLSFRYNEMMLAHAAMSMGYLGAGLSLEEFDEAQKAIKERDDTSLMQAHCKQMSSVFDKKGADRLAIGFFKILSYLIELGCTEGKKQLKEGDVLTAYDKQLLIKYIAESMILFSQHHYPAQEGPKRDRS